MFLDYGAFAFVARLDQHVLELFYVGNTVGRRCEDALRVEQHKVVGTERARSQPVSEAIDLRIRGHARR